MTLICNIKDDKNNKGKGNKNEYELNYKKFKDYIKSWKPKSGSFDIGLIDIENTHMYPNHYFTYFVRHNENDKSYEYWHKRLSEGGDMLPVIVEPTILSDEVNVNNGKDINGYHIIDGIHRIASAEKVGIKYYPALIYSTNQTGNKLTADTKEFSNEEIQYLWETLSQYSLHINNEDKDTLSNNRLRNITNNIYLFYKDLYNNIYNSLKELSDSLDDGNSLDVGQDHNITYVMSKIKILQYLNTVGKFIKDPSYNIVGEHILETLKKIDDGNRNGHHSDINFNNIIKILNNEGYYYYEIQKTKTFKEVSDIGIKEIIKYIGASYGYTIINDENLFNLSGETIKKKGNYIELCLIEGSNENLKSDIEQFINLRKIIEYIDNGTYLNDKDLSTFLKIDIPYISISKEIGNMNNDIIQENKNNILKDIGLYKPYLTKGLELV